MANIQPILVGPQFRIRPLVEADRGNLYIAARNYAGRTATVSDTVMHDVMEVLMKKIVSAALLAVALFGVTACSSYPGWVPDWAQIGAEEKS